jgi:phosphate transport system permease protein
MRISRTAKDLLARRLLQPLTLLVSLGVFAIGLVLLVISAPLLVSNSLQGLLLSSVWRPSRGEFGFYPFIVGTLDVTFLSMTFAVPICILTSVYVSEYAAKRVRDVVISMIDLLAGVPSVVMGLWGVLVIVPAVRYVASFAGYSTTGYSVLAGGIVLAIMVFPSIISFTQEVLRNVPSSMREASAGLGATKWQTVKYVVVRRSAGGILAAIILGFSRAFGETMAVLMVVGNVAKIPSSIFDPAYPLPALIANDYGDIMSIPLYDSALLFAALLLLLVVAAFTIMGRLVLIRIQRRSA